MKQKVLSGEAVAVWWTDARGFGGTMSIEELKMHAGGLPMLSIGLLVQDNDSAILLAQDYYITTDGQARIRDGYVIPKKYIAKMRKWKL